MQLKNYLPSFIFNEEFKGLIKAQQLEIDTYNFKIEDLIKQCFVNTATWGLKYWEEFLGIKIDLNKDIEFRRTRIIAKLRGQGTTTAKLIKNVAESFVNGEVEVIEDNAKYMFTVKFVGIKGIPPNLQDLENSIEEIKPAHLAFKFQYTYNTWNDIKKLNWGDVNKMTWKEIMEREVDK